MCINCLNIKLQHIRSYETDLKERIESICCNTCKNYDLFIIGVLNDLKFFCAVKIEKHNCCPTTLPHLVLMETLVKQKVKSKLQNIMEIIDEQKEEVRECNYLNKMNDIKDLYDCLESIESASEN